MKFKLFFHKFKTKYIYKNEKNKSYFRYFDFFFVYPNKLTRKKKAMNL